MPIFTSTSPFDSDVEKATSEMNTTEDWAMMMDICDKVKNTNGSKDCIRSIVKRMNHKVPFVSMQALTLLNACISNCGREFHLEVCSRDFTSECRTLIGQKAHPRVAQKLKFMIKTWSEMKEFKDDPALNLVPNLYESLKKEGYEFVDPDTPQTTTSSSRDTVQVQEEDDLVKAIALSLQENERGSSQKTTSLYPTTFSPPASSSSPTAREVRKVRALYDFEAAEDNELTFKAGEIIGVLEDSDPNWWKGFNQRGEGLFPANFVTADLSVEPEDTSKKVTFNEDVQVKTIEAPDVVEIDEAKIDNMLQLIQNADPTGEINPDTVEMLQLEEQCKAMGPLIDAELETIDKKHADLSEINKKVLDALQMYHNLMKEMPNPYAFKSMTYTPAAMGVPPGMAAQQSMYSNGGPSQYMPPGQGQIPPQMAPVPLPTQVPQGQMSQGQMSQGQPQILPGQGQVPAVSQGQMMPAQGVQQLADNYNNSATIPGASAYQALSLPQQNVAPPQQMVPSQQQNVVPPQNMPQQYTQAASGTSLVPSDYGLIQPMAGQSMYQATPMQQQLL